MKKKFVPKGPKMGFKEAGRLGGVASIASSKARSKRSRDKYYSNPKLCKECSDVISYEKRLDNEFCDRSCSAIFSNRLRPIRHRKLPYCTKCDSPGQKERSLCYQCNMDFKFENGLISARDTLKRYLLRRDGRKCSVCNTTEWQAQPVPIEVDHIDGNAGNDFPVNLRLICPNCHAQTPSFCGRNFGFGRRKRGLPEN